jgi:hypothetical protein
VLLISPIQGAAMAAEPANPTAAAYAGAAPFGVWRVARVTIAVISDTTMPMTNQESVGTAT